MISSAAACLALAVFFEVRGEPELAKHYTAHIVMNWAEERHVSPCDVIQNKITGGHFGFSRGKKISDLEKRVAGIVKRSKIENAAWQRAVEVAQKVNARKQDITRGARYFNIRSHGVKFKTKVAPRLIGKHLYY